MTFSPDQLLRKITRCPNVIKIINGYTEHPCAEVVLSQRVEGMHEFQVPEPWNGDISRAPLLYLSSNPSISEIEEYPLWSSEDYLIRDFFVHRFGGGLKPWVKDGKRALTKDGSYLPATAYWSEIINRSKELFGREVIPGIDYAVTEIVHCKSRNMIGVDSAIKECGSRYFLKVLQVSGASVIAAIGKKVGDLIKAALGTTVAEKITGPLNIRGKQRVILFLSAPGSNKPRVIPRILARDEIQLVRTYLGE